MINQANRYSLLIALTVTIFCDSTLKKADSRFRTNFLSISTKSFLIKNSSDVTAVFITCCGRYDFMAKALNSFAEFN